MADERHTAPRGSFFRKSFLSWAALVVALAVGAILYGHTLKFPFQFDDESYLLRNPLLTSAGNFFSIFDFSKVRGFIKVQQLADDVGTNFVLRPFTYFTFYLNYLAAGGWSEAGCRLVNILIHCLNGFLIFKLLSQLLRRSPKAGNLQPSSSVFIPAAAAVLFLAHPVQVESVTYITQRFTSLGTFFYLLTLWLYFQARVSHSTRSSRLLWGGSVLALVAGMFSKEEVFTAPLLMMLLDRILMDTPWKSILRRALPHLVCMVVIPVVIMLLAASDHSRNSTLLHAICIACPFDSSSYWHNYLLTEVRVVVIYLGLILAPHRLNVDWDIPESTSLMDGWMLASAATIVAILGGAWCFYRMARHEVRHALFFGSVLWYFVTLLPSSSIIPLPDVMADHRVYLPSIGVLAALACAADLFRTEFFRNRMVARAVPIALACWALGLGAATMVRNEVWRSGISLWADAALKSPNKFRPWGNLGVCYGVDGQLEEAKTCLRKAIGLKKDYNMGYRNLAIILTDQKKFNESIQTSIDGLRACGNDTMMHYNMAVAYCAIGRLNDGAAALRNALALSPNHFLSHFSLGDIYAKQAKYEEACQEYQAAGKLAPRDERVTARIALIQSKARSLAGN